MRTATNRGALTLLLLMPAACATRGDLSELRSEVRALSARQDSAFAELRRSLLEQNRAAMDSVRMLSDVLFDFRGDANNRLLAIHKQQVRLNEILGQSQRSLDQLSQDMDDQLQRMQQRIRTREEAGADTLGGDSAEPPESGAQGGTAAEQALYDAAVSNLERDLRTSARRGFTQFLDEYPRSVLAPAAHLHLGELLTLEGLREEAVDNYLEVPKLFPTSEHIPAALYRAGVLCIELEDHDRAREFLERVINTYPDDRYAELAREELGKIP
ncbi:MAG: tetratricopeptide repeat protein [Gemmatimonadota bacterium]|nr:tetratricopeptide repeat protein [Gemmatimonadota bacterium]MDE2872302.1 tetratricopeptide repeat protein [Gemmatimonadota bacterium]